MGIYFAMSSISTLLMSATRSVVWSLGSATESVTGYHGSATGCQESATGCHGLHTVHTAPEQSLGLKK